MSERAMESVEPVPLAKLLVVDDNADNRDLLARRLQRAGYSVVTAEDGFRALDVVQNKELDLVVLDIMMPGIDGLEVLRTIRERFTKIELPVLIATAKLESSEAVRALEIGANDYITKPLDFSVVKARIESQLQTRAQATSLFPAPAVFMADGSAEPGTVLDGKFEVLATLGSGGFAVVFKARQLSTGQIVALKVMKPHRIASGDSASIELARFEREMDLIGKLKHPHIVELIDSGTLMAEVSRKPGHIEASTSDSGTRAGKTNPLTTSDAPLPSAKHRVPYIAMEYLDGKPLSQMIANEAPMSVERVVELILPVISAVGAAHAAGVVHRDVKPPNIIVTHVQGHPHPKVLDFGIAKLVGDKVPRITTDERFLGTPEYMSPEQAQGDAALDGRGDQYTLAVILYEALTGTRPFRSESFLRLLRLIMRGDCAPPSHLVPSISADLEAVIMRAMHPDREMRFSSVRSFGRALLPFASEEVASRWKPSLEGASDHAPPPRDEFMDSIAVDVMPTDVGELKFPKALQLPDDMIEKPPRRRAFDPVVFAIGLAAGVAVGVAVAAVVF